VNYINTIYHTVKKYEEVKVQLHAFLTLALDGDEWSASPPIHFTPREKDPGTHWTRGRLGSRASMNAVAKREYHCPCPKSNPVVQSIGY
jgi:hypothetical protein